MDLGSGPSDIDEIVPIVVAVATQNVEQRRDDESLLGSMMLGDLLKFTLSLARRLQLPERIRDQSLGPLKLRQKIQYSFVQHF